jgi:hypothetical protein
MSNKTVLIETTDDVAAWLELAPAGLACHRLRTLQEGLDAVGRHFDGAVAPVPRAASPAPVRRPHRKRPSTQMFPAGTIVTIGTQPDAPPGSWLAKFWTDCRTALDGMPDKRLDRTRLSDLLAIRRKQGRPECSSGISQLLRLDHLKAIT